MSFMNAQYNAVCYIDVGSYRYVLQISSGTSLHLLSYNSTAGFRLSVADRLYVCSPTNRVLHSVRLRGMNLCVGGRQPDAVL